MNIFSLARSIFWYFTFESPYSLACEMAALYVSESLAEYSTGESIPLLRLRLMLSSASESSTALLCFQMASSSESIVVVSRFSLAAASCSTVVGDAGITSESPSVKPSRITSTAACTLSESCEMFGRVFSRVRGYGGAGVRGMSEAVSEVESEAVAKIESAARVFSYPRASVPPRPRRLTDAGVHAIISMKAPNNHMTACFPLKSPLLLYSFITLLLLSFISYSNMSTHFWNLLMPSQPNFSSARIASTTVRSLSGLVFE